MSSTENKVVIRVELADLAGVDTHIAYTYFKKKLGEPSTVDRVRGTQIVDYFRYESAKGKIVPVASNGRWGVDYVLAHGDEGSADGFEDLDISLDMIDEAIATLIETFGVSRRSCRLLAYTWYNGCDEPIIWKSQRDEANRG